MSKFMQISVISFSEKLTVVRNFTQSLPLSPSLIFADTKYTEAEKIENGSAYPLFGSSGTFS